MPGPSRRLLIPLVMKKVRIILPVLAFLFAVVAAFGTNSRHASPIPAYMLDQEEEVCLPCIAEDQNAEEVCTGTQIACECRTGEQLRAWDGVSATCDPVFKNE